MAYTTSDLITDIKLRAFVPTSQNSFTEADFLLMADAEMQTVILPLVQSLRADYYVTHTDRTIAAGQGAYDMPVRAVGMGLKDVHIVDASGVITNLAQIDQSDARTTQTGEPEAFYIRQNQVYLYPTPSSSSGTLRLYFSLRPGKLVLPSAAGTISSIVTASNEVTLSSIPSSWTSTLTYDLIRQDGGGEPLVIDLAASGVTSTTITFASALPSSPVALRTSDYVALAGQSPLPQMPAELRPVLAQAVAARIRASMRLPGADDAKAILKDEVEAAKILLTPRVQNERKVIPARHGWL